MKCVLKIEIGLLVIDLKQFRLQREKFPAKVVTSHANETIMGSFKTSSPCLLLDLGTESKTEPCHQQVIFSCFQQKWQQNIGSNWKKNIVAKIWVFHPETR